MERKHLHSFAVIAMTAAALALAVPGNAQGRRPGGGSMGGSRPSSSQSSSPRSSSPSVSHSSPRSSSPSVSHSSPRSSAPSMSSSTPRSGSQSISQSAGNRPSSISARPSNPSSSRPSGSSSNWNNNRPSGNMNGGNHGNGNMGGNRPSTGGGSTSRPSANDAKATIAPPTTISGPNRSSRPSGQVNRGDINRPGGNDRPGGNRPGNNDRPGGNMGNHNGDRPGGNMGGGNHGNRPGGNMGRPGGNNRPGGNMGRPGGNNRPGGNMGRPGGRPHAGINHGGPRPDYNRYRWHSGFRPRGPRDRWYDYYRYNRWSWLYPIAPPIRPWRPRVIWYYRPVIPTGFRIYTSAPIITGVLGLEFGTMLDASLNYLYYNGYSIDGYQDNVVYLRDVNLLGYSWPDVMLQYSDGGGLCYAEFATSSTSQDNYRFDNIYNSLCQTYGTPINNNGYYSWYGGDRTGFINLNTAYENGRYYTVLTFGT